MGPPLGFSPQRLAVFVLLTFAICTTVTNLVHLRHAPPSFSGHDFTVPFGFGLVAGATCLVGGQLGAYLNNRIREETTLRAMMTAYTLVGVFVVYRVFFL